jgi:pimeloyl-ACP methyl ester carboxylesterase
MVAAGPGGETIVPELIRAGAQIYYETHGNGPALLLTHGFGETADMWRGQIDAFARDHQVIVWDMRGHGRSRAGADPRAYSERETVHDMAAILDAVGAQDAVIAGLSLGGYTSLAFQLALPARTRALIVIDTGPGYRSDDARAGWNANALRTAARHEARARTGAHDEAADAMGLALAARGMLVQVDARIISSLPSISAPCLIVVGADDKPFLAAADYMAAKIPGARKVTIDGAGHMVNQDQPEAFNAACLAFLADTGV